MFCRMRSSVVLNTARLAMNSAGRGGSANLQSQSQQVYRGFFNIPRTFFSKGVVPSTATIAVRAFRTFNTQVRMRTCACVYAVTALQFQQHHS